MEGVDEGKLHSLFEVGKRSERPFNLGQSVQLILSPIIDKRALNTSMNKWKFLAGPSRRLEPLTWQSLMICVLAGICALLNFLRCIPFLNVIVIDEEVRICRKLHGKYVCTVYAHKMLAISEEWVRFCSEWVGLLASPQTSFGVRSSRIHFSPTAEKMHAWRTNPKGRLQGGYRSAWIQYKVLSMWICVTLLYTYWGIQHFASLLFQVLSKC